MSNEYLLSNDCIYKVLQSERYILVRHFMGDLFGVNCKLALKYSKYKPNGYTDFQSWKSCNVAEYIQYKMKY